MRRGFPVAMATRRSVSGLTLRSRAASRSPTMRSGVDEAIGESDSDDPDWRGGIAHSVSCDTVRTHALFVIVQHGLGRLGQVGQAYLRGRRPAARRIDFRSGISGSPDFLGAEKR